MRGIIDLVIEWDGVIYILDHKTTSQMGASFFDGFSRSFQMMNYVYACRELLGECGGFVVNGLLVAKTKTDFARNPYPKSNKQIQAHALNYLQVVADLEKCILRKEFYENGASCSYYGKCPYRDLCEYGEVKGIVEQYRRNEGGEK